MLTHAILSAWLLARMVSAIPPGTHQAANALETSAEQESRYEAIAGAIAKVALDPKEPPVFKGRQGTAALLLSVSYFESSWMRGVDLGTVLGDGGRSCTIYQLNLGRGRLQGFSCGELVANRETATRVALGALRQSAAACLDSTSPGRALLAYASGGCDADHLAAGRKDGKTIGEVAAQRIDKARKWLRENPLPKDPS